MASWWLNLHLYTMQFFQVLSSSLISMHKHTSIIKPLTAYLALESLYRTTTWAIRVGFGFMNWDTLIGLITAEAWAMQEESGSWSVKKYHLKFV